MEFVKACVITNLFPEQLEKRQMAPTFTGGRLRVLETTLTIVSLTFERSASREEIELRLGELAFDDHQIRLINLS